MYGTPFHVMTETEGFAIYYCIFTDSAKVVHCHLCSKWHMLSCAALCVLKITSSKYCIMVCFHPLIHNSSTTIHIFINTVFVM